MAKEGTSALRKLYRAMLLPAFAAVLLAAMWAAAWWQIRQEQADARHEAVLLGHAQARTLAENTGFVLRQADHATQLFKLKFEETEGALRLPEFTRRNGLLASLLPAQLALPLALYGPDGRLVDSMHGAFSPQAAGEGWFRALAGADGDKARFSTPVVEAAAREWRIRVARRLDGAGGGFAGAIVMLVDPAMFIEDYDRLDPGPGGFVGLLGRDTGLSTSRVDERVFNDDTLTFGPARRPADPDEVAPRHPVDGTPRIYAARDMPRYALTAVVGHAESHALARFERRRAMYLGAVALASGVVLAFVAALVQQARRLRNSTRAAREAQRQQRAAADASLDAVFLLKACREACGGDFILVDVNERGAAMLGHARGELLGQRIGVLVPAWRAEGFLDKYRRVLDTGQPLEEEFEIRSGTPRWLLHQIVAIGDGVAVTTRDITERKQAELASRQQQARLRTLADMMPAMIAYVDRDEVYRFQNLVYEREFTRMGVRAVGRSARDIVGERRYARLQPWVRRVLAGETVTFEEEEEPDADGTERSFEVRYIPQWDEAKSTVEGFHVVRTDVTAQRREKQHLLRLSTIDALTGLTNRAGFMARLAAAMHACRAHGTLMALMYMDIDRFKPVNDTHGHGVGDALLKAFAGRLTHALRDTDTVARLGGDEFTVILEGLQCAADAERTAAKLVAAVAAPFDLDGIRADISTSIGVAFYRGGELAPAELLARADALLYEAKEAGRNTFRTGGTLASRHPDVTV
ncbi:diguanylate cyclase [Massilia sp. METH4]|uniref:diguanylate cyclase domain-containing protein n=1 Tax=Massilia sp. METH4 TaxID=3123041 RepID=UPI0030D5F196